jgi:hypothetical protein
VRFSGSGFGAFCCSPLLEFEFGFAVYLESKHVRQRFHRTVDYLAGASAGTSLTLEFFETDGVTPVDLMETPEPTTLALFEIAGLALLQWRKVSVV